MSDNILCGILGFFIGGLLGGYLMGRICGKEYRKRIEALENENVRLNGEIHKEKEKAIAEKDEALGEVDLSLEDWDDTFGEDNEEETEDKGDLERIHMIDAETFRRDIETRDNETFSYYQEDGVLVDSDGEVVRNEENIIGVEAMEKIFDCGDDTDYVYALDEDIDKMYEIVVVHDQSYYRDVVGV